MDNHWPPPKYGPSQYQQQPYGDANQVQAPGHGPPPPRNGTSGMAITGIVVGGAFLMLGSCAVGVVIGAHASKTATSRATRTTMELGELTIPPAEPDPPGSFRDGTLVVGSDVAPGTYRMTQASPRCYWARLAGFSGETRDVLANDNESGPAIITIGSSDKGFESKRCGLWVPGLPAITESPAAPFGDGTYVVGTDIAPGTWRADSPERCYWARLRGFSGQTDDSIASAYAGRAIVTITAADKGFKSRRCGTWSRMD